MNQKERLVIVGGNALEGEVRVSGGKNTAVAVIPATLLSDEPCTIENVPDIEDVHVLVDILRSLGAKVTYIPGEFMTVDPRPAEGWTVGYRNAQRQDNPGVWAGRARCNDPRRGKLPAGADAHLRNRYGDP